MLFNSAYNRSGVQLNGVRDWLKEVFEKDYNDLSDQTKEDFLKKDISKYGKSSLVDKSYNHLSKERKLL